MRMVAAVGIGYASATAAREAPPLPAGRVSTR
jgi:hypothetical protein